MHGRLICFHIATQQHSTKPLAMLSVMGPYKYNITRIKMARKVHVLCNALNGQCIKNSIHAQSSDDLSTSMKMSETKARLLLKGSSHRCDAWSSSESLSVPLVLDVVDGKCLRAYKNACHGAMSLVPFQCLVRCCIVPKLTLEKWHYATHCRPLP